MMRLKVACSLVDTISGAMHSDEVRMNEAGQMPRLVRHALNRVGRA